MQTVAGGAVAEGKRAIPSLDGLRGLAVMLVVAAHLGVLDRVVGALVKRGMSSVAGLFRIDAGDLGVSVFFVISGFLITTLLVKGHEAGSGLGRFYARRFFRIFPPYYAYLLVVGLLWAAGRVPMLPGAFVSATLYCSNYFPYTRSLPGGAGWLVGHTWSLSLEEQFYLIWPVCVYALSRRRAAWLGVGLVAAAPFLRVATLALFPATAFAGQVNRMFHARIDTIMAGCVLALVASFPALQQALAAAVARGWTGAVALGLLWAALRAGSSGPGLATSFALSAEALVLAYLVAYAVKRAGGPVGLVLNWRPLRHLGVISYGLYLWQQLFTGPVHLFRGQLLIVPAVLAAAELSYWLVEKPSYWVRDRLLRG